MVKVLVSVSVLSHVAHFVRGRAHSVGKLALGLE